MEKRPYPQSKSLSRSARSTRAQRQDRLNQTRAKSAGQSSRPGARPDLRRSNFSKPSSGRAAKASRRRVPPPSSVSPNDLSQRRRSLRRQRGFNSLKGTWRLLAVGSAAVGLGWVMMQPLWVIKSPEQIRIKGINSISEETLQALIPLEYPKSLLRVKPQNLETALLEGAPINEAHVSRRLFPPGLTVQVVERQPVAIAELAINSRDTAATPAEASEAKPAASDGDAAKESAVSQERADGETSPTTGGDAAAAANGTDSSSGNSSKKRGERVLMDEAGDWIPLERYTAQGQVFELPKLKVIGMRVEYRQAWSELYPIILQSPVEVLEIDWQDPSNIKLQTDLGEAHFGPYSNQFAQQLEVLDKMRELPQHKDAENVAFIDLRSPTIPRLRMKSE